jgi:flavin reductase (DIM6/NTAB) family NADH-FMN oxidoreductase RutF
MQPSTQPPSSPAAPEIATALGRIPSGLFVVTWCDGGSDRCMLASWVMQAGFAPPQVSVAIGESRDARGAFGRCARDAGSVGRFGTEEVRRMAPVACLVSWSP